MSGEKSSKFNTEKNPVQIQTRPFLLENYSAIQQTSSLKQMFFGQTKLGSIGFSIHKNVSQRKHYDDLLFVSVPQTVLTKSVQQINATRTVSH